MEQENQLQTSDNSTLGGNTVHRAAVRSHTVPVHPHEYINDLNLKRTLSIKANRDLLSRYSYESYDDDSSVMETSDTTMEHYKAIPIAQTRIRCPEWLKSITSFALMICSFYCFWYLIPQLKIYITSLLKPKPIPITTKLMNNFHRMVAFAMNKLVGGLGQIFGLFKI